MRNATGQYRKMLEKKLRCSRNVKNLLLEKFDQSLSAYLEEHEAADQADLTVAFGPPEEMAAILMAEVTPRQQAQYRRTTLLKKGAVIALVILLAALAIYTFFYKEVGLTYEGEFYVTSVEPSPTQTEGTP